MSSSKLFCRCLYFRAEVLKVGEDIFLSVRNWFPANKSFRRVCFDPNCLDWTAWTDSHGLELRLSQELNVLDSYLQTPFK